MNATDPMTYKLTVESNETLAALADCLRVLCFPTVSRREEKAAIERAREVVRDARKAAQHEPHR